jgi:hypothetical protein
VRTRHVSPLYFWRDSNGREVDLLVEVGGRRIPVEIKAGATVAGDFLKGLDRYLALSGDAWGALVYGGTEAGERRHHRIRPWYACS